MYIDASSTTPINIIRLGCTWHEEWTSPKGETGYANTPQSTWSLNFVQLFERPCSPQMSISNVTVAQRTTLAYILSFVGFHPCHTNLT